MRNEGFSREQRVRRGADFKRCYRLGLRKHGTLASVHYHPNDLQQTRLGITASRKVGNSVVRHRLKRRVREIFRRFEQRDALGALDLVVHLKPGSGVSEFVEFEKELKFLLRHAIQFPRAKRPRKKPRDQS